MFSALVSFGLLAGPFCFDKKVPAWQQHQAVRRTFTADPFYFARITTSFFRATDKVLLDFTFSHDLSTTAFASFWIAMSRSAVSCMLRS